MTMKIINKKCEACNGRGNTKYPIQGKIECGYCFGKGIIGVAVMKGVKDDRRIRASKKR